MADLGTILPATLVDDTDCVIVIVDVTDSSDATYSLSNGARGGEFIVTLGDSPSDASTIDTIVVHLRVSRHNAGGDDTITIDNVNLVTSAETTTAGWTPDSDASVIATTANDPVSIPVGTTPVTYDFTMARVGGGSWTKAEFDDCRLAVNCGYSAVKGSDTNQIRHYDIWITGTYTTTAATSLIPVQRGRPSRHMVTR